MTEFKPPSPPYLGPTYRSSGTGNKPIKRIVIHSTVSPCVPGGARNIAKYFRSSAAGGSAHYVVDPNETVQCAYDSVVAWHAPPNGNSIGIEMCEMPETNLKRWANPNQIKMLARTARLTAELCLAYNVPPWYRDAAALRKGQGGVTTHRQVSLAFGQSSHWDPGEWPRRAFMLMVRREIKKIRKEQA